ncbi:DUF1489 family protein [Acuticoccus sp.]|uniref:DUF1489 family protein n=1 Tax=Acuticoccus sp. TaxID=1904378 RepID=UPI003B529320
MTTHLLKLAVGAASVDNLRTWATESAAPHGGGRAVRITTRTAPRRAQDVLAGGSLYWVVKGAIQARQLIVDLAPFADQQGIGRVKILLDPTVVPVRPRPCRPFQGWRYLRPDEAPADFSISAFDEAMPASMRRDLLELCLL